MLDLYAAPIVGWLSGKARRRLERELPACHRSSLDLLKLIEIKVNQRSPRFSFMDIRDKPWRIK
jgi:hypothetical protein